MVSLEIMYRIIIKCEKRTASKIKHTQLVENVFYYIFYTLEINKINLIKKNRQNNKNLINIRNKKSSNYLVHEQSIRFVDFLRTKFYYFHFRIKRNFNRKNEN